MRLCVVVSLIVVLVALLVIGIFLLVPFPLAVFPAIIKSQVIIQAKSDGQPKGKATTWWENLPAIQWYDFYFFNISNPDEVLLGEKPMLVEVGPYSYAETERKKTVVFHDDGKSVYYENTKFWVFNTSTSCDTCGIDDLVMVPNPAYMAGIYLLKTTYSPFLTTGLDILLLLLGEQPISAVKVGELLFQGYQDPLTNLVNSNFTKTIADMLNITMPPFPTKMGYFPDYSGNHDGNYTALTGKGNSDNLGLIQTWCNHSELMWWGDDYSRDIRNSGDGSFQKPSLKKTDTLKQFQSFTCRSFHLHYDSDTEVNGIKAYLFKINDDDYDTTIEKNRGYRYENIEMIDYFPSWPCGTNHYYNATQPYCATIDCSKRENFCDSCCNGSHYNGLNATVFLPPGIIPLRCLPGQWVGLPFAGFLSPPHFAWSPEEVINSMYGLAPDPQGKHHPGMFDIQPDTGSTVGGTFKMQLSVPIYQDNKYTQLRNTNNYFLPSFWINVHVEMQSYARNYIHMTTRVLPQVIFGVGIGMVALSCIGALLFLFYLLRRRQKQNNNIVVSDDNNKNEDWS